MTTKSKSALQDHEQSVVNGVRSRSDAIVDSMAAMVHHEAKTILRDAGFSELPYLPTLIRSEVMERQGTVPEDRVFRVSPTHVLTGSAEQSYLDMIMGLDVTPWGPSDGPEVYRHFATTQCYRREPCPQGLHTLYEFTKTEQIGLAERPADAMDLLDQMIFNTEKLCRTYEIKTRLVDNSLGMPSYATRSLDLEAETQAYGWMEIGTYTNFGTGQSQRFGWTGMPYSVFGTMVATPRFLIPLLERM